MPELPVDWVACTHKYTHTQIHAYTRRCMHTCMHTYIHTLTHTHTHRHTQHIHTDRRWQKYRPTGRHTDRPTYMNTCIFTYIAYICMSYMIFCAVPHQCIDSFPFIYFPFFLRYPCGLEELGLVFGLGLLCLDWRTGLRNTFCWTKCIAEKTM